MSVYVTSSKDKETFWKNVRHNENDPNCDFAVGARDGRVFPYIRALSTIPPGDEITVNFRAVDPAILNRFNCFADNVAKKLAAYEKGKLRQLSHANNKLYHANKKAADENAATEAKLLRSKRTLSMLLSKIDLKAENSVDADGELTSRLSVAVRSLLETTSSNNEDTGR